MYGAEGEPFGFAVVTHPSIFNKSYIGPFIFWSFYYLLNCASPLLIAATPVELGAGIFLSLIVWSSLANCVVIFVRLGVLENHPYLNTTNGMAVYGGAMLLMAD